MGEVTEYASKGVAGTGLGLGIAGTALGLLGNNGLGNLFGNDKVSALQAENSMLKSENYSDKVGKEVYNQAIQDNRILRTEMLAGLTPLIKEAHDNAIQTARMEEKIKCCCEKSELQNQILEQKIDSNVNLLTGKINETALALNGKIDTVNANVQGRFSALDQTIACISGKVNDITTTNVKFCKISPMPVPAAGTVPATGTTWYPGCVSPLAPETTSA